MAFLKPATFLLRRCVLQNIQKINVPESRHIKRWVAPTLRELERRREKAGPQPEQPRSTYLEWNYDAEVYSFGKRLNEEFDRNLLKQALTHRAYTNLQQIEPQEAGAEVKPRPADNWEMIQEGQEIISEYLNAHYSEKFPEEIVKAVHNYLTSDDMLAHVGLHIGLKDIILTSEFPVEKQTLANTFRAVISALKRSKGLERSRLFIKDFLVCQLHDKDVDDIWNPENPYQYLENLVNTKGLKELEPRLCNQSATNTILANYQVGIYSNKKLLGIGWGENIETAKNTAALDAIHKIYKFDINRL